MERRRLYVEIEEWLEERKRPSVKALTYDRLVISLRLMEKYDISNKQTNNITSSDIQRYLNQLAFDGYGISTIKKQYNLITAWWKYAMSRGIVTRPVYMDICLPNEENLVKSHREIEAYDHSEQAKMANILEGLEKPQYAVILLLLETGMRVGEALALKWADILWDRQAVAIKGTLVRLSSEPGVTYIQNSPKSRTSKRVIPLSDRAFEVLKRVRSEQQVDSELIFPSPNNVKMPFSYSSVEHHARRLCKLLDIPYKGLHAFRHTFATNCYERGCDVKILSKLLGHADVAITYNIYIHLYGDALEEMRKALG